MGLLDKLKSLGNNAISWGNNAISKIKTSANAMGERAKELLHGFAEGITMAYNPQIWAAERSAEVQTRNAELQRIQHNEIAIIQQDIRVRELQVQYLQHKEREANAIERDRNSHKFQAEQAEINHRFQTELAKLNFEHQKELANFRAKVDIEIQNKNLEFQQWSIEQQQKIQLHMQELNAELSRELKKYDRETALKVIEEQRKINNSPIWLVPSQILNSETNVEPSPMRVFLSPPKLPHDRIIASETTRKFPEIADYLTDSLYKFLNHYNAQSRPVEFISGAITSKIFSGSSAMLSLFDALKPIPFIVLDSSIEAEYFFLRKGYSSGKGCAKPRFNPVIPKISWMEVLNDLAKIRVIEWYKTHEEEFKKGKLPEKIIRQYGKETVTELMKNLETVLREQHASENNIPIENIERQYVWGKLDYDKLREYLAICHCLAVGLGLDEYFLMDVAPQYRQHPLLPALLSELLRKIPDTQSKEKIIESIVTAYDTMYQYLAQQESAWEPELRLSLAESLMGLPKKHWAKKQVAKSLEAWLILRNIPYLEGWQGMIKAFEAVVAYEDEKYIEKLNACLAALGESQVELLIIEEW